LFDSNLSMIVSNRQKGRTVTTELENLGIVLRYANLKSGDFLITDKIAVEIMTADEFIEAINNKMLFRKLIDFKRDFPEAVFILQGFISLNGKMNSPKIRSAISYITILNRMPMIMTTDGKDSAQYLNLLVRQAQHGLTFDHENDRKKERYGSLKEAQLAVLSSLPEVGSATAEALLTHFGSLSKVFKATASDLMKVGGIGKKKAERIIKVFEAKYRK